MLLNEILTLLSWKRIITNDKDHKRYQSYYLIRKGLKVYGFSGSYPTKEDWKEQRQYFVADKKTIQMTEHGGKWAGQQMVESLSHNSWRVTFKNHWIRFDELSEEGDSRRWRQQCPDYYLYNSGKKDDSGHYIGAKKIALFPTMILNYNGDCLNMDSEDGKKAQDKLATFLDLMRKRTNRMAKARRDEKKAISAAEHAKETNNWLAVNPADTFKVRNVSTRRLYLDHFSVEEIVESMKPEILDKSTINNSEYELLKFELDPVEHEFAYYLKMLNPSTGEIHLEGVGPYGNSSGRNGIEEETVEAALMWRDGERMYVNNTNGDGESEKIKIDYNAPMAIT